MKLCILAENGSVHNQKWIHSISLKKDIELHVISFDHGVKFENVTYYSLTSFLKNKLDYFLNIPRVKKIVKQIKPDILHAHYATSYGFIGAMTNFHPFVLTGWGADIFDSPKNYIIKSILKYALSKADAITLLSKITAKEISKYTSKHIDLIPFGVDISRFCPIEKKEDGLIRIGTVRTLSEKYGVEYLIRAFAQLSLKHDNIRLEIVGDGNQKQNLISLTKKLNISDKVTFHGFVSQKTDFQRYIGILRSFDIFAILSILDSETFGVAAVEASACKIPIVATTVGGLPEVVENEQTGLLVKPKNVSETALALEKLAANKNLRIEMGNRGRIKVENEFDWEKNVASMIALYNSFRK